MPRVNRRSMTATTAGHIRLLGERSATVVVSLLFLHFVSHRTVAQSTAGSGMGVVSSLSSSVTTSLLTTTSATAPTTALATTTFVATSATTVASPQPSTLATPISTTSLPTSTVSAAMPCNQSSYNNTNCTTPMITKTTVSSTTFTTNNYDTTMATVASTAGPTLAAVNLSLFVQPDVLLATPVVAMGLNVVDMSAVNVTGLRWELNASVAKAYPLLAAQTALELQYVYEVSMCATWSNGSYGWAPFPFWQCYSNASCSDGSGSCVDGIDSCSCSQPLQPFPPLLDDAERHADRSRVAPPSTPVSLYVQLQVLLRLDQMRAWQPSTTQSVIAGLRNATSAMNKTLSSRNFLAQFYIDPNFVQWYYLAYPPAPTPPPLPPSHWVSPLVILVLLIIPFAGLVYVVYRIVQYVRWRNYIATFEFHPEADQEVAAPSRSAVVSIKKGLGDAQWTEPAPQPATTAAEFSSVAMTPLPRPGLDTSAATGRRMDGDGTSTISSTPRTTPLHRFRFGDVPIGAMGTPAQQIVPRDSVGRGTSESTVPDNAIRKLVIPPATAADKSGSSKPSVERGGRSAGTNGATASSGSSGVGRHANGATTPSVAVDADAIAKRLGADASGLQLARPQTSTGSPKEHSARRRQLLNSILNP